MSDLIKRLALIALTLLALLYSLPNFYGEKPALQISGSGHAHLKTDFIAHVQSLLAQAHLHADQIETHEGELRLLFQDTPTQLKARDYLTENLPGDYTMALNLVSQTPAWLTALGATPMKLGLDLRGGIHFLLHVDVDTVLGARQKGNIRTMRQTLRKANVRYKSMVREGQYSIRIVLANEAMRTRAFALLEKHFPTYQLSQATPPPSSTNVPPAALKSTLTSPPSTTKTAAATIALPAIIATLSPTEIHRVQTYAVGQAMHILRRRVNELGISEAIVQQQGNQQISVDLPGIQDMARAKRMIGKTATLRFQLVNTQTRIEDALAGQLPPGSQIYYDEQQRPILLHNQVILPGSAISYATALFREGRPAVNIHLGGGGESFFHRMTQKNIGQPLAVVYTETTLKKVKTAAGKFHYVRKKKERIISVATIQSPLGNNFDITGLSSMAYAENLALLLRSGALLAPVNIIEELTIGPSLGKTNIQQGTLSLLIGSVLVMLFMGMYYRFFGIVANIALFLNILFIVAILSLLGATLTLPGIAGIVLTVGMAVDANILINERVREERRRGVSPLASIRAGYQRAFSTIVDANVTTLIVAIVLFSLGSGTIKGFAITLIIGLLCSMLTAIFFTRVLIEAWYCRRVHNTQQLSIGGGY